MRELLEGVRIGVQGPIDVSLIGGQRVGLGRLLRGHELDGVDCGALVGGVGADGQVVAAEGGYARTVEARQRATANFPATFDDPSVF
jgi:hypothetical protein